MKNYYNSKERKFTILNLEVRTLSKTDLIIVIFFAAAIILHFLLRHFYPEAKVLISDMIFILVGLLTIATPFGIRFRSIYFSAIWIVLNLLLLLNIQSLALFPLFTFITYHVIRFIFWKVHKLEFIPFIAGRWHWIRYVSKIEGRGGYKEDRVYQMLLILIGLAILLFCILNFRNGPN